MASGSYSVGEDYITYTVKNLDTTYGKYRCLNLRVYKGTTVKGFDYTPDDTGSKSKLSATVDGLNHGTRYTYEVWIDNESGRILYPSLDGDPETGSFTTDEPEPPPATYYDLSLSSGTGISSVSGGGTYEEGTRVSASASVQSGYTFDGWYSGGTRISSSNPYSFNIYSNTSLTAKAVPSSRTYRVSFYDSNGTYLTYRDFTGTSSSFTKTLPTAASLGISKTGHSFDGWSTYAGGPRAYTDGGQITLSGNTSLYARWAANTYTLSFNANGGSVSRSSQSVSYNGTYGGSYGNLPTPTWTGHSFSGWYTASSGGTRKYATDTYATAGNSTLYAHWSINTYTVTFHDNGGSGSPTAITQNYGTTVTIPQTKPTRQGYKFLGWAASSTGSKVYDPGGTFTLTGDTHLYAVWLWTEVHLYYGGANAWLPVTGMYHGETTAWKRSELAYGTANGWMRSDE